MPIGLILDSLAFDGLCPSHAKFLLPQAMASSLDMSDSGTGQFDRICHVCARDLSSTDGIGRSMLDGRYLGPAELHRLE